jgi:hypothetical protein
MRETLTALGPTELYTGPMDALLTRKTKEIHCLADCTFTKLNFQFPAGTPAGDTALVDPTDPSGVTFPTGYIIGYVAGFQLLTGTIQVIFES